MKKRGKRFFNQKFAIVAIALVPFVILGAVWLLAIGTDVAVLNPQGSVAASQKKLMEFTLLLSLIVVIPVYVMLIAIPIRYREGNHKAAYRPDEEGNKWLEATWWGIPILIIGVLSVVTWTSTHDLEPSKALKSDVPALKVQVVALQWKWLFLYPEQNVATVNELRIPAGTPVKFELTADAPMSAFWIPSLGTQTYAMTGMSSKLNLIADNPGTFRGSNTNISGKGYAHMDFSVIALKSRADFDKWVDSIVQKEGHGNMDWTEYKKLVKPNIPAKPSFLHLHDADLYNKIIDQYMSHKSDGEATTLNAHGHEEGQGN